jgi:hypothetical protein
MSKANVVDIEKCMDKIKTFTPEQTADGLLDEAVHHVASQDATEANNGGFQAQVTYLLERGCTVEDVLMLLDSSIDLEMVLGD